MENEKKVNGHAETHQTPEESGAPARRVRRNSPLVQAAFPDREEIALVKRAAAINGAPVSRFVRMAAVEVAKRVIDRHSRGEF